MAVQSGWPCAALAGNPPSVEDALTDPTADTILPQVLALTPRGAAWGGNGGARGSVMRGVWRAVAGWAAASYRTEFEVASEVFPSAISRSLPDWETELGLPDACTPGGGSISTRILAVRARYATVGGASPDYFVCLAASLGYTVSVEESTQFECDTSECGGDDELADFDITPFWTMHVGDVPLSYFHPESEQCDVDPIERFVPALALECVIRRVAPRHTAVVFSYTPLTTLDRLVTLDSTIVRIDAI